MLICEISIVGNTKVKKNTIDLDEIDEGIMNSISDQINCSKNGNLSNMVDANETNCNISSVNETWMSNTTINSEPSVSCFHTASTWSEEYKEYVTYIIVAFGLVGNSLSMF